MIEIELDGKKVEVKGDAKAAPAAAAGKAATPAPKKDDKKK
jgi:hypothetical protein